MVNDTTRGIDTEKRSLLERQASRPRSEKRRTAAGSTAEFTVPMAYL